MSTALNKKLTQETIWSFLTKGLSMGLFVLVQVILGRSLGPESYGQWSVILALLNFAGVVSFLGINNSMRRYAAQYRFTERLGEFIWSGLLLRLMASILCGFVLYFLAPNLLESLDLRADIIAPWLMAAYVVFHGVIEFNKATYFGLHDLRTNFFVTIIEFGGKLMLTYLVLAALPTYDLLLLGFVVSLFSGAFLGAFLLGMKSRGTKPTKAAMGEIGRYALPMLAINIGFFAVQEIDVLMLGSLANSSEVGIYNAAKQLIIKFPHVTMALAAGTMAVFADLNAENKAQLQGVFKKLVRINALIFAPVILGFLLLSPWLMEWIYGPEFTEGALTLRILTIYLIFASFSVLYNQLLDYRGKAKRRAWFITAGVLVNVGLNFLLIPSMGSSGAAIATAATFFPYLLLCIWEGRKVFKEVG